MAILRLQTAFVNDARRSASAVSSSAVANRPSARARQRLFLISPCSQFFAAELLLCRFFHCFESFGSLWSFCVSELQISKVFDFIEGGEKYEIGAQLRRRCDKSQME